MELTLDIRREINDWYWDLASSENEWPVVWSTSVAEIAEAYSLTAHQVRNVARSGPPLFTNWNCLVCGDKELMLFSREEYKRIIAKATGHFTRRNPISSTAYCMTCRDRAKEANRESNKRWLIEQKQREFRRAELRTMPYAEYLRTPEWKETREHALKRFQYHCAICNATARLDVHHRTYARRGAERMSDLTVLCRECHARHHGKIAA